MAKTECIPPCESWSSDLRLGSQLAWLYSMSSQSTVCSNDWKQIEAICLGRLPSAWNTACKLTAEPSVCYMLMMKDEKYIILHCDSFCTVQLETERYESPQREYITHSPQTDERRIFSLPTSTITPCIPPTRTPSLVHKLYCT